MVENKIQSYAKACGYDYARKTALIWNGNKVYKLKIQSEEGVKSCRGYPQYLLVNGNKIKKATPEEALQIMRKYYGIKED